MSLYSRTEIPAPARGRSEFEILKASHKFLRDEDDLQQRGASWDERLAEKYYDSLFREFAVCDLKHYKSGNFSLRWRTESEVLSGAGESTCGNTRCTHHDPRNADSETHKPKRGRLTTLELPFAYEEHGEAKSALVKTVLCEKCLGKMMWKKRKEREAAGSARREDREVDGDEDYGPAVPSARSGRDEGRKSDEPQTRRRNSRSWSPARRPTERDARRRERSPKCG
uniref:Protein FRA10AC1 n=1 Tax=Mycena chlorophos TaxID=658473 RepID=A0ABQ0LXS0_MYCCL|nr:predicted protein [Mycena chlorophos]